jgi:uncharacterized SAM-binding protein YcdF (DUF218 family)
MGASGEEVLNGRLNEVGRSDGRLWTRATPRTRRALVLMVALGLVVVFVPLGVSQLGYWLVVADPLQPARAVVVLSGRVPFRAMEAASIYRQGWAPEVWLTKEVRSPEETALDRLGIAVIGGEVRNREVLERLGVPLGAVRVLSDRVQNTVDETRLIARELRVNGADRVILVSSKTHSRRVRVTWSAIIGASPRAVVRYAAEEPYQPGSWWRNTRDALDVSREAFGLLNVWAGFPIQPDRFHSKEGRR